MKLLAAVVLSLATLLCLPLRPLWVDEVFQLEGTWHQSYPQMLHNAMVAPGGMPLAYAAQKLYLDRAGLSAAQARVPAALFGLGAVFTLFWMARLFRIDEGLAMLLGFVTPLLFRYATEARPYSQGLFFSALSTVFFVSWYGRPSLGKLSGYFLACLGGVYSQPFSLFVPCAHVLYLLLSDRRRLLPLGSVVLLTGLLYAPWVLASSRALRTESWPREMFFSMAQISPGMMVREVSGGGYVCSISLLLLAYFGWRKTQARLLLLCIIVPVILALGADAVFNYFFAIRQLIFILPPLLILAAAGGMDLWNRRREPALMLLSVFVVGAVVKDIRWQLDKREDWSKAAAAISDYLHSKPGCVEFIPAGDAKHYYFFQPALKRQTCGPNPGALLALVAISPYDVIDQQKSRGWTIGSTLLVSQKQF